MAINYNNNDLYITDAICGLAVVGSGGGVATTIANSANGVPFLFLDSIDIDLQTETVYFTDAGAIFQKTYFTHISTSSIEAFAIFCTFILFVIRMLQPQRCRNTLKWRHKREIAEI